MAILRPLVAAQQDPPKQKKARIIKSSAPSPGAVLSSPAPVEESGRTFTDPSQVHIRQAEQKAKGVPPRKFVPRSAKSVTQDQITEMFITYCQLPNIPHVARTCGQKVSTVRAVVKRENFEARREAILKKAQEDQDYTLLEATKKSIELVKQAKEKIAARILFLDPKEIKVESLASDIERLVKLEQLLLGGVESREEKVHTLSHEDRIRKLREHREHALPDRPAIPGNGSDPKPLPLAAQTLSELSEPEEDVGGEVHPSEKPDG